jgi:hypothetical protein
MSPPSWDVQPAANAPLYYLFPLSSDTRHSEDGFRGRTFTDLCSPAAGQWLDDQENLLGATPGWPAATPTRHALYVAHKAGSVTVYDGWRPIRERLLALAETADSEVT